MADLKKLFLVSVHDMICPPAIEPSHNSYISALNQLEMILRSYNFYLNAPICIQGFHLQVKK